MRGKELEGIKYIHPFENELKRQFEQIKSKSLHSVILSEQYVTTEDGSGLVHCAPGCGPEDFEAGSEYGLPPFNNVNEKGIFENMGEFSGFQAKRDDHKFVDALKKNNALITETKIEHEYATCWRCRKPIIFRATEQWFMKIEDLIKIMIVTSSNHAAAALADFYVFNQKEFVKLMNKKAADLSMGQTVFFDPAGLSPLNQSTANDIKKLIKYIDNNHSEILAYSQEKVFGDFKNINHFAGQSNFLGGKTGYLEEAKQNLVSLFLVDNRRILIIVLGAEDRFGQTQDLLNYLQHD